MHEFSKENEELRVQLSKAKSKLTEKEQKIIQEKDTQINQLSETLMKREEMYKNLLKDFDQLKIKLSKEPKAEKELEELIVEKERELEKINFMNASYRAQLIELKISMSKAKDASRIKNEDQFAIKIDKPEFALEEAKEKLSFQQSKIEEQDSIITVSLGEFK